MKFRSSSILTTVFTFAALVLANASVPPCHAQSAILSEIYGRGVHAYNSGQYEQASQWLGMAIENGFADPRAYYFRGLAAAASGRSGEAESDFQEGARLEARAAFGNEIGRSLARVQGSTRIQLEMIREQARLKAMAEGMQRSQARYGELGVEASPTASAPPADRTAGARPVTPPAPPTADNPFADDLDQDPEIDSDDAFKGAMQNAIQEPAGSSAAAAPAASGTNPFGGDSTPADDPFGSSAPADDPFGAPAAGSDPFGGGGAMDDPFGASPF